MGRVLHLPDHGHLIVCTDLQGCLRDFKAIALAFRALHERTGDAHVLFTGDLVHGPYIEESNWPDFLGEFYRDQSGELMEGFVQLAQEFPGRVHALLGNHEHGHVGGPHTAKFAMDEVALLEYHLGAEKSEWLRGVLSDLPLVAVTRCGAVFCHGAPAAKIESHQEIEETELILGPSRPADILDVPVIGPLLWARSASRREARSFARALGGRFTIYGHDVVPSGFDRIGDEQMCVSTSFGVLDSAKTYVLLDLAAHYSSVYYLRVGCEILVLYPDKARPRRRRPARTTLIPP